MAVLNAVSTSIALRLATESLSPLKPSNWWWCTSLPPSFLKGAHVLYAHTVLQGMAGMGYLGEWAENSFADVFAKNDFFNAFGESFSPRGEDRLRDGLSPNQGPEEVLALARSPA